MNSKERIDAAVHFQEVDRVPATILDGGVWMAARKNLSLQNIIDMDQAGFDLLKETYEEFDSDIVFVGGGMYGVAGHALGAKVNLSKVGASGETAPTLERIEDVYKLKDLDLRKMLLESEEMQKLLHKVELAHEYYGDSKYVAALVAAPFTTASVMIGVQKMMELILDEDENLPVLYDLAVRRTVEIGKLFAEHGADILLMADPVASGALISEPMFEECSLPLLKRALSEIDNVKYKMLHICGDTHLRLEALKELDIDIFSLDSVDLKMAVEAADGKYAILGNLSPYAVLESKSPEEITEICKELCRTAGKHGGFILSSGCDVTPRTSLENLRAMLQAPALV